MKNNRSFTEKQLKIINSIAHSNKFHASLKKINKDYSNFENFITDFESHINKKLITAKKNNYSTEDMIFDSIINRLELLNNYKKIAIRIFLESQKDNSYFLLLSKFIYTYFSSKFNSYPERVIVIPLYGLSFNVWIEDNSNLDKTMSFLGNSMNYIKKIKPFLGK